MPRSGSAQSFLKHHGVYYLFDMHYPLAKTYVQILLKKAKTVQNVGPQCKRSDVNGGEDNAVYKAYFHSCVRCPGADQCANPLMYQQLLYPRIYDISINTWHCYRACLMPNDCKRDLLQHGRLADPSSRSLPIALKRSTTTPNVFV